jgi:hypothetical protein
MLRDTQNQLIGVRSQVEIPVLRPGFVAFSVSITVYNALNFKHGITLKLETGIAQSV